jgi:hypothetical protein
MYVPDENELIKILKELPVHNPNCQTPLCEIIKHFGENGNGSKHLLIITKHWAYRKSIDLCETKNPCWLLCLLHWYKLGASKPVSGFKNKHCQTCGYEECIFLNYI